jgi:hypothetical protein
MQSVEQRIAARRHHALDHLERDQFSAPYATRGMAVARGVAADIVLSVEDVARIVAAELAAPVAVPAEADADRSHRTN